MKGIDEYLGKTRSVTCFDIANRFNIRMSVARKLLREKEAKGELVPYIREGGFIVYTTPFEMEKRASGVPIMTAAVFERVASSVTSKPVITEEMDEALVAAGTPGAVKPGKLAYKRRERGERKERKDDRPEVVVEPLEAKPEAAPTPEPVVAKKKTPAKKKPAKKEEKPKKAAAKKPAKKDEKPKKTAAKKPAKKEEKPKKTAAKKPAKKEEKPKKAAAKKPAKKDEKPKKAAAKKTTKKATEKKEAKPKKTAAKKDEKPKKAAAKKTTKK